MALQSLLSGSRCESVSARLIAHGLHLPVRYIQTHQLTAVSGRQLDPNVLAHQSHCLSFTLPSQTAHNSSA